ncbi:conserved hypothetical protein [Flavobacterium sp. 9AF]|uniref:PulJ/GspJ family protein n=1 Tax=Flavobacterium sp. 9AF TaxID=2653142 RepID=UPI0012F39C3D|nr:prepilin-type N-terminal cleavage/methylation domain-containing protein [Flavobacterium sp. 9AF]VXB36736.1 conserved hypothetical protein [Flavobacterium sp. 9AF]
MNTKTKSFTLSEMLVVLIITAIVVGLAFSVLTLVRKQIFILQTNAEQTTKKELFEYKLNLDCNRYSEIKLLDDNTLLLKSEIDSVLYTFNIPLVVLNNQDTIATNLHEITYFYKNKLVNQGRIDAIKIMIEPKKGIFKPLFIYKTNDATELNDLQTNGF